MDSTAAKGPARLIRNEEVTGVVAEIPQGHRHLRTTVTLSDGSSITFQEATIAALVRAYIGVKTDPLREKVVLSGLKLEQRKAGYAEWQLVEEADEPLS
jgi:hypothetical protein